MYFDPEELKILAGIQSTFTSMQVDLKDTRACLDRIIDRISCKMSATELRTSKMVSSPIKEKTIAHMVAETEERKHEEVVKLLVGVSPMEKSASITEIVAPREKSSSLPVALVQETTESLLIEANALKVRDTHHVVHYGRNLLAYSGYVTDLNIHPSHILVKSASLMSSKINWVVHGIDPMLCADHCLLLYDKPNFPANHQFRKLLAFKGGTDTTVSSIVRLTTEKKHFTSEIMCVRMRTINNSQRPCTTDVEDVDAQNDLLYEEYAPKSVLRANRQRILFEYIFYFQIQTEFLADPVDDISYFRVEQCLDSVHAVIMIGLSCFVGAVGGLMSFMCVNTVLLNSFLLLDIKPIGCPLSAGVVHFFPVIVVDSLGFLLIADNYMGSMLDNLSCLAKRGLCSWGINHLYLVQMGLLSRQICMIPQKKSRQATHSALIGTVPTTHLSGVSLCRVFFRSLNNITKQAAHSVMNVHSISFLAEVILYIEEFFALQGSTITVVLRKSKTVVIFIASLFHKLTDLQGYLVPQDTVSLISYASYLNLFSTLLYHMKLWSHTVGALGHTQWQIAWYIVMGFPTLGTYPFYVIRKFDQNLAITTARFKVNRQLTLIDVVREPDGQLCDVWWKMHSFQKYESVKWLYRTDLVSFTICSVSVGTGCYSLYGNYPSLKEETKVAQYMYFQLTSSRIKLECIQFSKVILGDFNVRHITLKGVQAQRQLWLPRNRPSRILIASERRDITCCNHTAELFFASISFLNLVHNQHILGQMLAKSKAAPEVSSLLRMGGTDITFDYDICLADSYGFCLLESCTTCVTAVCYSSKTPAGYVGSRDTAVFNSVLQSNGLPEGGSGYYILGNISWVKIITSYYVIYLLPIAIGVPFFRDLHIWLVVLCAITKPATVAIAHSLKKTMRCRHLFATLFWELGVREGLLHLCSFEMVVEDLILVLCIQRKSSVFSMQRSQLPTANLCILTTNTNAMKFLVTTKRNLRGGKSSYGKRIEDFTSITIILLQSMNTTILMLLSGYSILYVLRHSSSASVVPTALTIFITNDCLACGNEVLYDIYCSTVNLMVVFIIRYFDPGSTLVCIFPQVVPSVGIHRAFRVVTELQSVVDTFLDQVNLIFAKGHTIIFTREHAHRNDLTIWQPFIFSKGMCILWHDVDTILRSIPNLHGSYSDNYVHPAEVVLVVLDMSLLFLWFLFKATQDHLYIPGARRQLGCF